MIERQLTFFKQARKNFLKAIEDVTYDNLHVVPANFKNNIIWNFVHIYISQPILIYRPCALEENVDKSLFPLYAKGTGAPKEKLSESDFTAIKEDFIRQTEVLAEDYTSGKLKNYQPYETSYGFTLQNVEDAIFYNNIHENIHYGYVLALKKVIA